MITPLPRALAENRLEDTVKRSPISRLLISDESAYLPIDCTGGDLGATIAGRYDPQGRVQ